MTAAEAGVRLRTGPGRWVLAVTALGSALGFLDVTVVNVALPAIGRDLDAQVAGLQWVVTGYTLSLAALILLGGALGDRYGRRRVFQVGVVWFTVTSLLCALAPGVAVLVGARIAQGVGAALVTPGSLAIIEASFRREDRGRAIGAWSALSGIAAAAGPVLGGYLIDVASWRAVFVLNVPLGVVIVGAAARYVPESRDPEVVGGPDLVGALLLVAGLGGVSFALIDGGQGGSAAVPSGLIGLVALAGFVGVQARRVNPMLPLGVFTSRRFAAANAVTFVVYAALGGVFFLLVIFLQTSLGYSPVAAGAATLPVTALMLALSARSGALAQRVGPRLPLTVGPLLLSAGMILMTFIDRGDSYPAAVLPAVVVFGLGLAATVAPVTAAALHAAPERHAGVASGVNNAVSRIGGLVAVAGLPVVAGLSGSDFADPAAMAEGFRVAMLVTAAVAAGGGVLALVSIGGDVDEQAAGGPARRPVDTPDAPEPALSCAIDGAPLHPGGATGTRRRRRLPNS